VNSITESFHKHE